MSRNLSALQQGLRGLVGAAAQALPEQLGVRVFASGIVGSRSFTTNVVRKTVTISDAVSKRWEESLFPKSGDSYVLQSLSLAEKNKKGIIEIKAPFSHKLVANGARVLQDLLEHQAMVGCHDSSISLGVAEDFLAEKVGLVFLRGLPESPSAQAMRSYKISLGERIPDSVGSMFFSPLLFLSCYSKLCGLQLATDYGLFVGQELRRPKGSHNIGVSYYSPNGNGNLQFYTIEAKDVCDKLSAKEIEVLSQPLFSYKIGDRNGLPFAVISNQNGYTSIHFNGDAFKAKKIHIDDCDDDLALEAKDALKKLNNILQETVIKKSNSFACNLTEENSAVLLSGKFGGVNGVNPIGQFNKEDEVGIFAPLIEDFDSPSNRPTSPFSSSSKLAALRGGDKVK